jgi:iron complex transport system permease protein
MLSVLLIASVLVSLTVGASHIPLRDTLGFLVGDKSLSASTATVLAEVRLPRVLAAAMIGSALSIAGLLFQGLFRNPLAEPLCDRIFRRGCLGARRPVSFCCPKSICSVSAQSRCPHLQGQSLRSHSFTSWLVPADEPRLSRCCWPVLG